MSLASSVPMDSPNLPQNLSGHNTADSELAISEGQNIPSGILSLRLQARRFIKRPRPNRRLEARIAHIVDLLAILTFVLANHPIMVGGAYLAAKCFVEAHKRANDILDEAMAMVDEVDSATIRLSAYTGRWPADGNLESDMIQLWEDGDELCTEMSKYLTMMPWSLLARAAEPQFRNHFRSRITHLKSLLEDIDRRAEWLERQSQLPSYEEVSRICQYTHYVIDSEEFEAGHHISVDEKDSLLDSDAEKSEYVLV